MIYHAMQYYVVATVIYHAITPSITGVIAKHNSFFVAVFAIVTVFQLYYGNDIIYEM